MQIPEKVKIGGVIYDVVETENLTLGMDYNAEILYASQKINLRPMSEAQKQRTFLHEVLHGIYDNLGNYKDRDNEKRIDELAGALYALIVDNPEMFAPP